MCKTAKEVWHTLIITHQGNSQVKNCKIDLLTQEYEKFLILNEETIDSDFTRFNAIVTSLKSLDPDYSSKNHVRKFPPSKTTKEKVKSLALKAKVTREQTSDDSDSQGGSDENIDDKEAEAFIYWLGTSASLPQGSFCEQLGMSYNLLGPFTSQSNEIVERTHRKLRKMSCAILAEQSILQKFWCHALDMATYILNMVYIRKFINKTPCEIIRNRKPSLEYFRVFDCKVIIINTKVHLTKFDPKSNESVLFGYSQTSKAYIVLNKETIRTEKSLNVTYDESFLEPKSSSLVEDDKIDELIV
nr:retrovirus-related Pol polyprotein from transposon TNT 1-94 [Tanacetum cinerariifolium]